MKSEQTLLCHFPTTATANAPRVTQRKLVSKSMLAKKKYGPNLLYASVIEPFDKVRDQLKKDQYVGK